MFQKNIASLSPFLRIVLLGIFAVALLLAITDPKNVISKPKAEGGVISSSTYTQLLAIEAMRNDKARLGYANGSCETANLSAVLAAIKEEGKSDWFFGIPLNGTKRRGEYVNLVYVDHFEKIICSNGEYYRARLNVQGAQCRFVEGLIHCGTDLFTRHTYYKMVNALENLGVGDADYFKPRRTIRQRACECQ